MTRGAIAFVALAVISSSGMAWAQPATSVTGPLPDGKVAVYSVKFLCGFQPPLNVTPLGPKAEPGVKPGNYATAVNIHNFHTFPVNICKKAVVAPTERCFEGHPGEGENCLLAAGTPRPLTLGPNGDPHAAVELDCIDIVTLLQVTPPFLPSFIKGFVEIAVFPQPGLPGVNPLSVTGVYTSLGCALSLSPTSTSCTTLIGTGLEVEPQNSFIGEIPPECVSNQRG